MKEKLLYSFLLVITALIWGTAFVAQSVGVKTIGSCTLNASRSFIGGLALIPCIFLIDALRKKKNTQPQNTSSKTLWKGGVLCGLVLGFASMSQQYGIAQTTVGKSGFLTALYIIMVPLFGLLQGRKLTRLLCAGVLLAITGMYLLCFKNDSSGINAGDIWVFISSILFTFHILVIDHFAPKVDCVRMSCIQFFVAGVLSTIFALTFENNSFADILKATLPILYLGIMSSGVAYTLQVVSQSKVHPVVASLLMSLESVFAALSGAIFLGEKMSPRELFGCIIIFAAVILAQLPTKSK